LFLVDLLVRDGHPEDVGVVPDGLVEVGHGDAHVIDRLEQGLRSGEVIHTASVDQAGA
jgi:hypothetical protein